MRVRLSTYTTRAPSSRPSQAKGTATPAPVVSTTLGRTALRRRKASSALRSRFLTATRPKLRLVGPWAKTTRSSASSDRASLLSNVTQTRENPCPGAAQGDELEEVASRRANEQHVGPAREPKM